MKTSLAMMAKHFGELATVRGILTYKLSPFEQRAFAGAISHGIPNIFRRIRSKIFIVTPRKYLLLIQNFICSQLFLYRYTCCAMALTVSKLGNKTSRGSVLDENSETLTTFKHDSRALEKIYMISKEVPHKKSSLLSKIRV